MPGQKNEPRRANKEFPKKIWNALKITLDSYEFANFLTEIGLVAFRAAFRAAFLRFGQRFEPRFCVLGSVSGRVSALRAGASRFGPDSRASGRSLALGSALA